LKRVVIIGCGVVGAAIAYELSLNPTFEVVVLEQAQPAAASTGAALGVLVAIISQKVKGRNWRLRQQSWSRFQTLIPELEAKLGQSIQCNRQGILNLCFGEEDLPRWESLQAIRQRQGFSLEIWSPEQVAAACPHLRTDHVAAGIYSPQDFQVNPTELTQALVKAAAQNGVEFHFGQPVVDFAVAGEDEEPHCTALKTLNEKFQADYVVLASGLGTTPLTEHLQQPIAIGPVLGQALQLHLEAPLGNPDFQPLVNGDDVHLVPIGNGDYWVGATVEFPPETTATEVELVPEAERLEGVLQAAIAYCPALAEGTITRQWFGLRPRPQGQGAPVIKPVQGYSNVWLATGHYRNGVLLAPATALLIREQLEALNCASSH
jgi:glycine oxidase